MAVPETNYYLLGLPEGVHPEAAEALKQGALAQNAGQPEAALAHYDRAAGLVPERYEPQVNRASLLLLRGELPAALRLVEAAWAANPSDLRVASNLGLLYSKARDWEGCARIMGAIREQQGPSVWVDLNIGTCHAAMLDPEAARPYFESALHLDPSCTIAQEKLVYLEDFMTTTTPESALARRQAWWRQWGVTRYLRHRPSGNDRDPDRPLRVGYVSADWHAHSALYCWGPVLRRHTPAIEPYAYVSLTDPEDAYTANLKRAVPRWRNVATQTDDQLADLIYQDRIDILVDLAGFTTGSRLGVHAEKPAPVQVTAWGYATGMGWPVYDAFFADPVVVPAALESAYTERVLRLPSIVPYEPPWVPPFDFAPDADPGVPSERSGAVTFASLNRAEKMTPETVRVWGAILRALPDSRLVLKSHQLTLPGVQARVRAWFEAVGVASSRLDILGTTTHPEHMAALNRVDICLDPFPHSGGVTAIESLWMGVPVVTRLGPRAVERLSASFLTQVGHPEWIAESEDEYASIALDLAKATEARRGWRRGLRSALQRAPLCQLDTYTDAVEAAYRDLWQAWCRS